MAIPDKPINRYETYLAKIAGQAVEVPDYPITREEAYLDEIAKNGGGGGGSEVTVEQIKTSGEKIATITVDGEATDLYASAGGSGGGAVDTVNGKTGDVVLTASDVGALPDNTHIPADQIQSDWEQSDNTKKDYIKNKPTIPDVQIQSDWSQSDDTKKDYIKNKPTLGTAAAKDVPASGNAGNDEVVLGNDSRLSDARNAADVSSWAKAANKPTYTASEVGAIPSTDKGANGGVATLGNDGKVPSSQLPSMSGGHTIKDDGTAMTDRSGLNFIDHDLTDDSSGNETIVKPHRFTSEEMEEICSPLPDAPTLVGNMRMTKLWENSNPTSAFSVQDITLSNSDYDMLTVVASWKVDATTTYSISASCRKGENIMISACIGGTTYNRGLTRNSDTSYNVKDGYSGSSVSNVNCVPLAIYGIKLI